jgi:hypothetical protein
MQLGPDDEALFRNAARRIGMDDGWEAAACSEDRPD